MLAVVLQKDHNLFVGCYRGSMRGSDWTIFSRRDSSSSMTTSRWFLVTTEVVPGRQVSIAPVCKSVCLSDCLSVCILVSRNYTIDIRLFSNNLIIKGIIHSIAFCQMSVAPQRIPDNYFVRTRYSLNTD